MSNVFTSIFNNNAHIEGVRSLCAARGSNRHRSMLEDNQGRAARHAARCQENQEFDSEVTPFDFNLG